MRREMRVAGADREVAASGGTARSTDQKPADGWALRAFTLTSQDRHVGSHDDQAFVEPSSLDSRRNGLERHSRWLNSYPRQHDAISLAWYRLGAGTHR